MEAAKEVGNVLQEAKEIEIMKASEVFERMWEIFSNLENTGLSFVDEGGGGCGWVLSDDQEDLRI